MSTKAPSEITIRRVAGNTYPEKFKLTPTFVGMSGVLTVASFAPIAAVVDENAGTLSFPVSSEIANASPAQYPYDVVLTVSGEGTRTIVQGTWILAARKFTP